MRRGHVGKRELSFVAAVCKQGSEEVSAVSCMTALSNSWAVMLDTPQYVQVHLSTHQAYLVVQLRAYCSVM
jgi:hypothetical protein